MSRMIVGLTILLYGGVECAQAASSETSSHLEKFSSRKANHNILELAPFSELAPLTSAISSSNETVVIKGHGASLRQRTDMGGKQGLSIQHNPVSIHVITQKMMQERGNFLTDEAMQNAPGVLITSNSSPGEPCQLVMRGFGDNQVLMDMSVGLIRIITILRHPFYGNPVRILQHA